MADQDQTSPTYTEEEMAAFEKYEKDLEEHKRESEILKEHRDAGYDLYPEAGAAIGMGIPLTGAATSGIMNLGSKAIDAISSRPSAGERWGEAVGGPGGKTVDEAVRNREIAKTIKPGEIVTKEGVIIPESAAPKPTPKVTPQAAKTAFNPEELDLLRRTGLLRKVLAGAGTGFDIGDAYKRYQQGDTTGAIISGLGALGYPISKIPYPPAAGVGYGMMFGAPALNMYRDSNKPVQKASGGLTYLKKPVSHFAGGGEAGAALDALKVIKEAIKEAKSMTPGYLKSTPKNPNPEVGSRYVTENLGNLAEKVPFDPVQYKGASVVMVPWDSMTRNQKIKNISGVDLTTPYITEGGFDYPRDISHINKKIAGASGEDIAKRIQKRFQIAQEENLKNKGTGIVLGMPSTMGLGAETFQTTPTNITLDLLKQRELPKSDIQSFDEMVRGFTPDKKAGPLLRNFVGFNDPRLAEQLTLGGFGLETTAPELRKGLMDRLSLKGSQEKIGYNIEDLQNAILDPNLKNLPKGYMGHTVFEADPSGMLTPSKHSAFNTDFPGLYKASGTSMPAEVMMPNEYNRIYIELANKYPTLHPNHLRNMTLGALEKRNAGVSQMINNEVIDNYGKYMEGLKSEKFNTNNPLDIINYIQSPGYAEGGPIKGGELGVGLKALSEIKAALQEAKAAAPAVNRIDMNFKDVTKRVPEVSDAFKKLTSGEIDQDMYDALVNQYKPVTPFSFVPQPVSTEEAITALNKQQQPKYGAIHEIEEGAPAKLRLDIPAYTRFGKWINSIHQPNKPTVYNNVSHVTDAVMDASVDKGMKIAGGGSKTPYATINGLWKPVDETSAVKRAQEYLNHPDWAQVGFDPERHSYFYDRATMQPVSHAEEVLQIGPLVLAKKPKYGNKKDFKYAEGGEVEFTNKYGTPVGQDQYGNQVLPQPTELDLLKEMIPDRSTLKAIPRATGILGNKLAEEAKKEWNKSGIRSIPDIALNSAALLGGGVSDLISAFSPSLNKGEETNPMLGVGQEKEKPNFLGYEQMHDFLREKGITKDDYPLAENALLLGGPSLIKRAPGLISKAADLTEGLPVGMSIKDVSPRFTSNKVQFTSPLEDALGNFPKRIESMPSEQWKGWLRNQPANVKKEAEASGLSSILGSKSNVSKEEILSHVNQNSPRVNRKTLGDDVEVAEHADGDFFITGRDINPTERFADYNDALYAAQKYGPQYGTEALTLPDGDRNYREILLKLPEYETSTPFTQGHFPKDKNVLAHLRVNDRTSAEGKRALFLEELQSDWGQKGRKTGFDAKPFPKDITPEELKANHYHELNPDQKRWMNDFDSEMERILFNKDESGYESLLDKFSRWTDMQNEKRVIPGAPYVKDTKDWTTLGLKHALKEAIEGNKEQVAWTTGAQQNFRNMKESAPKGMEDFYDKIMIQSANDLLKKLGVKQKVRQIEFDLKDQLPPHAFGDRPEYVDPNEIIPAHRSKQWGFDITPELREKILKEGIPKFEKGGSVIDTDVRKGGLKATNYPNPYGLRSWQDESGEYRGQMMPKTSGWQGEIPTLTGDVMTEQSLGGNTPNEPFYPLITQNMSPEMIGIAKEFEAGLIDESYPEVQQLLKNAKEEARRMMEQGKSPFKDYN